MPNDAPSCRRGLDETTFHVPSLSFPSLFVCSEPRDVCVVIPGVYVCWPSSYVPSCSYSGASKMAAGVLASTLLAF